MGTTGRNTHCSNIPGKKRHAKPKLDSKVEEPRELDAQFQGPSTKTDLRNLSRGAAGDIGVKDDTITISNCRS